jgi:hypothetical protein
MGPATTGLVSSTTVGSGAGAASGAGAGSAAGAAAAVAAAGFGVAVRGVAALRFVDVAVLRLLVDLLLGMFASDRFSSANCITDFERSAGGKKQFFGL